MNVLSMSMVVHVPSFHSCLDTDYPRTTCVFLVHSQRVMGRGDRHMIHKEQELFLGFYWYRNKENRHISYVCAPVIKPILPAARRYRIAMLLLSQFAMAYLKSYESNFSELIKEVTNEVFNYWQWLQCQKSDIPNTEMIPNYLSLQV